MFHFCQEKKWLPTTVMNSPALQENSRYPVREGFPETPFSLTDVLEKVFLRPSTLKNP